jgi:hypothetical protein
MNLAELNELTTCLSAATLADPFLALCSVTAWLDPLSAPYESFIEEAAYGGESDDWTDIGVAWEIARTCFPEVYAETTLALRGETDERQLAQQVCDGINRHFVGGELFDLEALHFGIPFFGRGVDLGDPEFFANDSHARLLEVYAWFGVEVDPATAYGLPEGFQAAVDTANVLTISLRRTGVPVHEQVAWLLDWLFSQSGNSVVDLTNEEVYEMGLQPLEWEPSDLEFNNHMHAEADEIIDAAMQGLQALLRDEPLQAELRANLSIVSKQLRKENRRDRDPRHAQHLAERLRWADRPDESHEQRPFDDFENLQLRRADAA